MQAASESMALNDTAIEEMSEGFNVFDLKVRSS